MKKNDDEITGNLGSYIDQPQTLFQTLIENVQDIITIIDDEGIIRYVSPSVERVLGYDPAGLIGTNTFDLIHPDDISMLFESYEIMKESYAVDGIPGQTRLIEVRVRHKDGTWRFTENMAVPLHIPPVKGFVINSRDISERRKQKEELLKLNRTLRAISNCNQIMMRITDELQLLQNVCRIVVEDCGYRMVWIGYAEEDENKTVKPMAYAGFEEGYLRKLNVTWTDTERGHGPTGIAIRTGEVYICHDMQKDPSFVPWREEALKRGYVSSLALPLKAEGKVFGALTIYSSQPDPFLEDEVHLLRELSGDLEYGISAIRLHIAKTKVEQRIKENEERLEQALKVGHAGSFDWDAKQDVYLWSDELLAIYGFRRDEISGRFRDWLACVVREDREIIYHAVERARETDKFTVEFRIRRHDTGELRWTEGHAQVFFDAEGKRSRIIGINVDITERKRAEEALRENEERYRITLQNIPDAVSIQTIQDARYLFVNEAFVRLTGYSYDEVIEKNPFDLNLPLSDEDKENYLQCIMEKNGFNRMDLQYRMRDGTIISTLVSCTPIRYKDEDCVVMTMTDVTAFKRSEEEKKRLEVQLSQTQKMEALGTLAGGIAHDFNNILTAIMGYAEIARMNVAAPEKVDKNLENALKSCKRARDLVSQILSFSRHAGGDFVIINLNYTIEESLNMLRAMIPMNIGIRRNLVSPAKVMADPSQINRMMINLCINAAQAMGEKGGSLEVSLEEVQMDEDAGQVLELNPGSYLKLTISDTGCGMPQELIARIFEPYFTTKGKGSSSGLGLSIVHGIVKRHGGAIACQSTPGTGTTFEIYLPQAITEEEELVKPVEVEIPTGTERILFVDDEKALVDVAENLLASLGYNVSAFTSSVAALDVFEKDPSRFDLVVTDMTMPGMMGDKLAQEILEIRPDIPVIMYTGYSEYISEEKAKSIGIRKFILKPFEIEDLAKAIRQELLKK